MEDLLATQYQIMEAMNSLLSNFKKDGSDRKAPAYIKKRLSSLEGYWQEFQCNHIKLYEYDDKSHEYFALNLYKRTSESYSDTRAHILKYLPSDTKPEEKQLLRPATPLAYGGRESPRGEQQSPSIELQVPPSSSGKGASSKLEEMLRKQKSNFKALARTIDSINLDNISEKWELEDVLETVQKRWSVVDSLHWEIDSELYEENVEYEQAFGRYEQQFNQMKTTINKKMWAQNYREKSTPQMEVPTFTGNYQQWVSFKDLFVEAIHSNRSLSNAQKLQFLKGKLRGEAEKLVQHLPISSGNYEVSWDILNRRYNNKKLIFNSHVSTLMNLPSMQQQSAAAIKKIFDTTNECLNAIKALGVDINNWDPLVVYIISNKLDADTHIDYIESLKNPRDLPTLNDLLIFLENKFTSLEASRRKTDTTKFQQQPEPSNSSKKMHFYKSFTSHQNQYSNQNHNNSNKKGAKCAVCNKDKDHGIYNCETFLEMQPYMRQNIVKKLSLCKNCLHFHGNRKCFTNKKCRECEEDHNTLLHDANASTSKGRFSSPQRDANKQQGQLKSNVLRGDNGEILLATALIKVAKADGSHEILRALVDQGSQTSLITDQAAQMLGLKRHGCKAVVVGVGSKENKCKGVISITLSSLHNDYTLNIDVFVTKNLVSNLPNRSFIKPTWPHIENIQLADPEFYTSRPIDILLGADVYSEIILCGIIKENSTMPIAQQTRLGWILCGSANVTKSIQCNVTLIDDDDLHKFWSIEDVTDNNDMSSEDYECLQLYQSTTERQADGRYVVHLPLHSDVDEKLGQSKPKALAQFYQLERKFKRQEDLAIDYKTFINEYQSLGHMQLLAPLTTAGNKTPGYYMPHHCVRRADSTTTSLRVVFNASETSSSGYSLNDLMFRGPNLQKDLLTLVLKWRRYQYAFTADIEKMFRQIMIHPNDQIYQKIIWRDSANEAIKEYQLATVTYGTKAAPFLAMMTLRQLAKDECHRYPAAAKVLEEQFYTDDLLSGCYTKKAAKELQTGLINLLSSGGFNLRKWASNEPSLIANMSPSQSNTFDFRHQESTKTLGLAWNSKEDLFTFQCKMSQIQPKTLTKRVLLSEISKIFDPLGWLAPVVIQLKLLFQNIWTLDLQWDEQVPDDIFKKWMQLREDIEDINKIRVPRWIESGESDTLQLFGFCDSSTKAFAGVVYSRIQNQDKTSVTLLAAKTKVVPIKKPVSLPRLELCGALLLSKLMLKVIQSLNGHKVELYGWCDSTAVLGWLQGETSRWKPFVANRVKKITEVIPAESWNYVKSNENPADCASRGLSVNKLKNHPLWWKGPTWLPSLNMHEHKKNNKFDTDLEKKKIIQTNTTQVKKPDTNVIEQLINRHSNFARVTRVLAWIMRVINQRPYKQTFLTADEISNAKLKIIRHVQSSVFVEDINHLQKHGKVKQSSKISNLNPYLDKDGGLRVGGRLENSNISEEMKHPLIIPHSSHLTDLIIDHAHKETFHGGARLTLSSLRKEYWIVGGNRAVKKRLHRCVICRRHSPIKQNQLMGDLPEARTNPTRPFYHTGVDFTGFVNIKANKGRGIKTTKGYVAFFICMVTKAVHLELVSDLTSSAFLAALRRLAARRGTPRHIQSDNATNFTGSNKILSNEYLDLKSVLSDEFLAEASEMKIEWHFNAPSWPSAGELWEAAVKSLKYHLRRVVGEQKLTYEEFSTLLSQLEACLNSRPLCAISEDPNDIDYLTPSHFLASGPVLTIYETERDERTRWQLTQKIFQDIWRRWRAEYLAQLSTRSKWQQIHPNMKQDDIVIIHDANLPAGKWALGRVVDLHPGKDGHVRVVSIKTKNGVLKRPIVKLSPLLVNSEARQCSSKDDEQQNQPKVGSTVKKPSSTRKVNFKTSCINFKTSCINFMTTLFMLFMLCATTTVQGAYDITSLQTNSIYFNKLSEIRMVQDKWKLIVYYNMEPYWKGTKLLNAYSKHLDDLCSKSERRSHCDIITLQLRHSFSELEYYDRMLRSQRFDKRAHVSRTRRGLINGVGYLANSLFGVLDEHFAEQYQKDITKIRNNQKHLVTLWKNQTSVIEAENNLLRRVENSMETQYKIFKEHLNTLEQATNNITGELEQIGIVNEFMLSSIIANNVLNSLKNIQDTLLDTLTNVQHFNIHILAPEQLRDELSIISGQLSKDTSLPIDNIQTDLPKMYKILRVRARMTAKYFIFEITIPLVNRDSYDLYKTCAVPRQVGSTIVSISPIADYLAINLQKDTYLPISEIELQKCTELDKTSHLCELQKPVYHRGSDNNFCVKDQQNNTCKTITNMCHDTWVELVNVNNFLLTCCNQCNFRFICGDQVTTERLTGVNIIALGSGCVIKGESFTITSHQQYTNELNVEPDIVIAEIAPVNKIFNLTIPISSLNESNFKASFEAMDERITQMKSATDQLEQEDEMSSHDVHQYVAIYVVAAVALGCAAFTWWRSGCAASTGSYRTEQPTSLACMPPVSSSAGQANQTAGVRLAFSAGAADALPSAGGQLAKAGTATAPSRGASPKASVSEQCKVRVSVCDQCNVRASDGDQCDGQYSDDSVRDIKRTSRGTSPSFKIISFKRE